MDFFWRETLFNPPHAPFIAVLMCDYCLSVAGDSPLPEGEAVPSSVCILSHLQGALQAETSRKCLLNRQ